MSIPEFVAHIESLHFSLSVEGDTLSLKANRKKLDKQEIDAVRQNKEIIDYIRSNKDALMSYLHTAKNKKKAEEVAALYRLSGLQEGMLFYGLYDEGTGAYINQLSCDLLQLDEAAFLKSWQHLIAQHSILRSSFYYDSFSIPVQCVYQAADVPLVKLDYRHLDEAAQAAAIKELEAADARRAFDFKKAPVMRLTLIQLPEQRHRFIWTHHHILLDGWSVSALMEEFVAAYEQLAAGRELLEEAEDRYEDYIRYIESRDKEADERFWRDYLREIEEGCLLPFVATTAERTKGTGTYGLEQLQLSAAVTASIEAYAQRHHITVNTLMQGVWACLLRHYTGRAGVTFGVTVSGRPEELPGVEHRIGMYINTLPVFTTWNPEQSATEWLQQIQAEQSQCREHQYTTLNDIQRWTGIQGDLFDTILVFENYPVSKVAAAGQSLQLENIHFREQTNYPLDIMVETSEELLISFNYNADLLDAFYVKQIRGHFEQVLMQMVDGRAQQLKDIVLITAAERQQLVHDFNQTDKPFDLSISFHHYVAHFAAQTPDKTAIIANERSLTYKELNDRVNRMAAALGAQCSIREDDFLAVFMDRSENMAAAILATWKLGGAYIPVEKKLPDNRIINILEDAGVKAVIAERALVSPALAERILLYCPLIYVDDLLLYDGDGRIPDHIFNPHSLSFSVFTSGSTGKPKGAMSEHIGMMNHALATIEYLGMDENSVLVQNASHSFDISVWQFFTAFVKGGTTLVFDDEVVNNAEEFLRRVMAHKVTVLQVVPTYLNLLLDILEKEPAQYPLPVQRLVCGGEILKPETVKRWFALYPGTVVVNDYGPAEASDGTCWYVFDQLPENMQKIPIGTSIYNMRTYIVDDYMNLCPVGVVGEVCVAGVGVGRGYIGDPEKTAAVFTNDPFADTPQRLYKTGDLARYLPDGLLEFHGRKDYQVKVNGQRIELGEIEAKLAMLPGVKDAAVIAADDANGRKYLCAFIVFHEGQGYELSMLKELLSKELPPYMVPRLFQELGVLPVNANGKVDRKLLARMNTATVFSDNDYAAPESAVEQVLVNAWQQVLKKERVGVTDNFYESGGDSISAIQVASQVYRHGYKVEIKDIMKLPTIRKLAYALKPLKASAAQGPVTGTAPLTPIQADFFAMQKEVPHHYNQSVMLRSAKPLEETAVRKAWYELVNYHDALRTVFIDGQQHIRPAGIAAPLQTYDWRGLTDTDSLLETTADALQASLDIEQGPLLQAALFHLPQGDHLFLTIHHLLIDTISWRILLEDFATLYEQNASLPAKTDAFKIWAERLLRYANSSDFRQEIPYWHAVQQQAGSAIPADTDAPAIIGNVTAYTIRLNEITTTQLTRHAHKAFNTEINDLLVAALGLATARTFGLPQLSLAMESHGRPDIFKDISVSRTVGWFTAEYPVVLPLQQVDNLPLHIKQTKEILHKVPNNGIGYGLAKYLTTNSPLRHAARPQLVFNYLGATGDDLPDGDLVLLEDAPGAVESLRNRSDYPLELIGFLRQQQLVLTLYYHHTQFKEQTIHRWMQALQQALEEVTALCTGATIQELTPSDYDYKDLSIAELDELKSIFG
ncbi:non-ribosomal peptide synthetase [Chitinophaga vietnamensis]|uniref:non-ribosomal peptide synthetase n=1 Tax=Chitinophaga vietnamensis TaxID=2593957 RepID=UPI001177C4A0|nr:non-ribosomal peptide synthetase [Chitinophaga vietnamensis]